VATKPPMDLPVSKLIRPSASHDAVRMKQSEFVNQPALIWQPTSTS